MSEYISEEELENKKAEEYYWHDWFAWYPVVVPTGVRYVKRDSYTPETAYGRSEIQQLCVTQKMWMTTIERRRRTDGWDSWWQYRVKESV